MGFFSIFKRKKETEIRENIIGESFFDSLIKQKELLSEQQAKQIGAVASSVDFISDVVAMLPIRLYRDCGNKAKEITDDNRIRLLNEEAGDTLDAYQMKKAFINDYFYKGAGFIFCNKERNSVKSLHYVDKVNISYVKNTNPIFKQCTYNICGKEYQPFQFIRILRNTKDGVSGESIMQNNALAQIALYKALEYESTLISSGGSKKGFLRAQNHLQADALNQLRKAWKDLFSSNENNMMILNDGLEFKEISNNLVEMQLNENKKTNTEDIYSLFHLTQKAVSGELSTAEFANVLNTAIQPFLQEIVTAINAAMLLEEEKEQGYYFAFDIKAFLKADTKSRYEAYKIGIDSGVLQIDEARYEEDLPPIGLEFVKLGLQDVLYDPKKRKIYTPNTNAWASMEDNREQQENPLKNTLEDDIINTRCDENQPRDDNGRWTDGSSNSVSNEDYIVIGKSVGAKAKNYKVVDKETGEVFGFVEGTKIQNAEVFAGYKSKKPLNTAVAEGLTKEFGGTSSKWQHSKGIGIINCYGDEVKAEVHWFQEETVGKVKFKIKRWLDED